MSVKYTKVQANTLNMLSEAAKHVREQTDYVKRAVAQIEVAMESGQQPSYVFGKNKLSEAISRFIAVENMAAEVLVGTGFEILEVEASLELARKYDPSGVGGKHYFHEG